MGKKELFNKIPPHQNDEVTNDEERPKKSQESVDHGIQLESD